MTTKKLSTEDARTLVQIQSSLMSNVASFTKELQERHLEDPDDYPLDDGTSINEWFTAHISSMEW
jgi:hypothetical protein